MLCWSWLECDECEDDECDRFVKRLGPSSETERRAHDSSNVCSGIIPSDTELLQTFEVVAVRSAGVDCDSSWSVVYWNIILVKFIFFILVKFIKRFFAWLY